MKHPKMSKSTSPSQSGNGRGEIEAAKQRLLVAKKWVASAKKQLLTAKMEEQEAEKFLRTIEDKHEVTYVDSGDEKEEDDDNKQTKGNTASQEGEEEEDGAGRENFLCLKEVRILLQQ